MAAKPELALPAGSARSLLLSRGVQRLWVSRLSRGVQRLWVLRISRGELRVLRLGCGSSLQRPWARRPGCGVSLVRRRWMRLAWLEPTQQFCWAVQTAM